MWHYSRILIWILLKIKIWHTFSKLYAFFPQIFGFKPNFTLLYKAGKRNWSIVPASHITRELFFKLWLSSQSEFSPGFTIFPKEKSLIVYGGLLHHWSQNWGFNVTHEKTVGAIFVMKRLFTTCNITRNGEHNKVRNQVKLL